jgi:hypothetical protein
MLYGSKTTLNKEDRTLIYQRRDKHVKIIVHILKSFSLKAAGVSISWSALKSSS